MIDGANPDSAGRETVAVGNSILQIEQCSESRQYNSGDCFIVEVIVLQHDNPADPPNSFRKLAFTNLDSNVGNKAILEFGRIKNLLAALYSCDAHASLPFPGYTWGDMITNEQDPMYNAYARDVEVTWGMLLHFVAGHPTEPLKGRVVKASGYDKPTKKLDPTGKPYNKRIFTFEPYTG